MKISKRELTYYIKNYLGEIQKLVENNHQLVESINITSNFPTKFPVETRVYFGKRGFLIKFYKSEIFSISFNNNMNLKKGKSKWSQFLFYNHYEKTKNKPIEIAKADFNHFLSLPLEYEEHEKDMEDYYRALEFEALYNEIDNHLDYIQNAQKVVEETRKNRPHDLREIIASIQKHISNFEYMLRAEATCLDSLHFMIYSDLETSLFLAINGKYYSAIAILRKILEVNIKSIYCDTILKTQKKTKIDDWLNKGTSPIRFRNALNVLLKNDYDLKITDVLRHLDLLNEKSFKTSISTLYSELCIYVHIRPTIENYDDAIFGFSEFDNDKWTEYHKLFCKVTKYIDILLVTKIPKILIVPSLSSKRNNYKGLQISRKKLEVLSKVNSV